MQQTTADCPANAASAETLGDNLESGRDRTTAITENPPTKKAASPHDAVC